MTPREYRENQKFPFDHFLKLTRTGICPNYDNIENFAENYYEAKVKNNVDLHSFIKRFLNGETKIDVNTKDKKQTLLFIFEQCGLPYNETAFTFEVGRLFWVENGLFGNNKSLNNSMELTGANRNRETIYLSEINVL